MTSAAARLGQPLKGGRAPHGYVRMFTVPKRIQQQYANTKYSFLTENYLRQGIDTQHYNIRLDVGREGGREEGSEKEGGREEGRRGGRKREGGRKGGGRKREGGRQGGGEGERGKEAYASTWGRGMR